MTGEEILERNSAGSARGQSTTYNTYDTAVKDSVAFENLSNAVTIQLDRFSPELAKAIGASRDDLKLEYTIPVSSQPNTLRKQASQLSEPFYYIPRSQDWRRATSGKSASGKRSAEAIAVEDALDVCKSAAQGFSTAVDMKGESYGEFNQRRTAFPSTPCRSRSSTALSPKE
jgi:hypothetical protein